MSDVAPPGIAGYVEVARAIVARDPRQVVTAVDALRDPPEIVASTLRHHHLVGLVRRAITDTGESQALSPTVVAALEAAQPVQRASPEMLLETFSEVEGILESAGIPVLLLKGLWFAERLYGGIERRPQFDVDVLVRRQDARRALAGLVGRGYKRTDYDLHSWTLARGGVKLDVHHCLRAAPAYRLREESVWAGARVVQVASRSVRTLSDEHAIVLLVLGLFEDLGQGMARLKQLVDLVLLLGDVDATFDWPGFMSRRERENLLTISLNVLTLALESFDARAIAPRLGQALERLASHVRHRDREQLFALLAAPRKHPANLAWFADVYPGSFARYLARFWWGGFPANLRQLGGAWLMSSLRLALRGSRGLNRQQVARKARAAGL